MPRLDSPYSVLDDLAIGVQLKDRVPHGDQRRQRAEIEDVVRRLQHQPGVILADEVGMGKTFVALGVACSVAMRSPLGPVVIMVPANLIDKWVQDLKTFCELYLPGYEAQVADAVGKTGVSGRRRIRYGEARDSIELMKLLDDPRHRRAHLVFLAQGAMARRASDWWVRLALIAAALRTHGRGRAARLIQVRKQIHRFLAELMWAIGEQRRHGLGAELWQRLLKADPSAWRDLYNAEAPPERRLEDDPVPKAVIRGLERLDLKPLAAALECMPVRAVGGSTRVSERITIARDALREAERALWMTLLSQIRWRSPLLVMDEAHHLKNPRTLLARQLQSADSEASMRTGDGAMARAFDRMLFLTATPFQLGHHELVRVLERFGDVRWNDGTLGERQQFSQDLTALRDCLDESQRAAIGLQREWSRLTPEDCQPDVETWWARASALLREDLPHRQRAVLDAYQMAKATRERAEKAIKRWVVRHNKGHFWDQTAIARRARRDGAAISNGMGTVGLPIPPAQLLPFFLAARAAISAGSDVLGGALSSSYEAFRFTRQHRKPDVDALDDEGDQGVAEPVVDLARAAWYLDEFDRALEHASGSTHPKIEATVRRVVDLWEAGEKVLVFAFYRQTCRALRIHISDEIRRRLDLRAGGPSAADARTDVLERVRRQYFDDATAKGRQELDAALVAIVDRKEPPSDAIALSSDERTLLLEVMRRFLRVETTLVRSFPMADHDRIDVEEAVEGLLAHTDGSGLSWNGKFERFIEFLTVRCSPSERIPYLQAAHDVETGSIRVRGLDSDVDSDTPDNTTTLSNVQVATGLTRRDTRQRLMRAFNTPFFPDILVCSEVMGEGVDLHRFCRHVIHHDLAWNPSSIEQRTGRVDRLGCKAEGRHAIEVYVPYLAGTADERQYQVMSHREQWFRVVMGQEEVARLITPDTESAIPLPSVIADELNFKLGLVE